MSIVWNLATGPTTKNTAPRKEEPKMEFYAPEYPNGPIEGDVDYRRTIYWNPNVKTDDMGTTEIKFYNNSYSRSLNVSVEGMANGEFIVYDSEKE